MAWWNVSANFFRHAGQAPTERWVGWVCSFCEVDLRSLDLRIYLMASSSTGDSLWPQSSFCCGESSAPFGPASLRGGFSCMFPPSTCLLVESYCSLEWGWGLFAWRWRFSSRRRFASRICFLSRGFTTRVARAKLRSGDSTLNVMTAAGGLAPALLLYGCNFSSEIFNSVRAL